MKQITISALIALIALLALAGCTQTNQPGNGNNVGSNNGAAEFIIEYSASGFTPNAVTIKQGDTVKWVNKSTVDTWPASAKHPTHEVYPGSGITKCGTAEESGIFDACKGIPPNGSYSFKFNEKGTWFYHDHLDSKKFGQITVE